MSWLFPEGLGLEAKLPMAAIARLTRLGLPAAGRHSHEEMLLEALLAWKLLCTGPMLLCAGPHCWRSMQGHVTCL